MMLKKRKIQLLSILLLFFSHAVTAQCVAITALPDTIPVCPGQTVQLDAQVTMSAGYEVLDTIWTPAAGLSDSTIANPIVIVTGPAQYMLTVRSLMPGNQVVNGDFSAGNTGFTTSYTYGAGGTYGPLSNEGTYRVAANPASVHSQFASFYDHTSGNASGSMLVVNGASTANVNVWCQTITVVPGRDYDFSAWGASCVATNPARLQFSINGTLLGTPLQLPAATRQWVRFHEQWHSSANTSANICIRNQQTAADGNDFALDDIEFREICAASDSVYLQPIRLETAITETRTNACGATTMQFIPVHSGDQHPSGYLWDFGDGSTSVDSSPMHTYTAEGSYLVTLAVTLGNCTDTAYQWVDVSFPLLRAGFTADRDSVCVGMPVQFTEQDISDTPPLYYWDFGDGSLSYAANPVHRYGQPGDYTVMHVVSETLCSDTLRKMISVRDFSLALRADREEITAGETVVLETTADDRYQVTQWKPAALFPDPAAYRQYVIPDSTTTYMVTGRSDYGCVDSTEVTVWVRPAIFVPSAFTPDGNGRNDRFRPLSTRGTVMIRAFEVFDRWGSLIYAEYGRNTLQGWDGLYRNTPAETGVYFYRVEAETGKGTVWKQAGDVTLIR